MTITSGLLASGGGNRAGPGLSGLDRFSGPAFGLLPTPITRGSAKNLAPLAAVVDRRQSDE